MVRYGVNPIGWSNDDMIDQIFSARTRRFGEVFGHLVGVAMDRFGPPGFPASLFAVGALYTLFAAWRQATRGRRTG